MPRRWEKGVGYYLEPSYEKAVRGQFGKRRGSVLKKRKDAPCDIEERDQPVHWDMGEHKQERELADDSSYGVESLQHDQLVTFKPEVFL